MIQSWVPSSTSVTSSDCAASSVCVASASVVSACALSSCVVASGAESCGSSLGCSALASRRSSRSATSNSSAASLMNVAYTHAPPTARAARASTAMARRIPSRLRDMPTVWFPDTALSTGGDCLSMGNVQPFTIRAQCGYGKHVYSVFDT